MSAENCLNSQIKSQKDKIYNYFKLTCSVSLLRIVPVKQLSKWEKAMIRNRYSGIPNAAQDKT